MPETKWRDYLKGTYSISNRNNRYKMHFEIRNRAIKMMEDLLLICRELPYDDRVQIFFDPAVRETIAIPLSSEIKNNTIILSPENRDSDKIGAITKGLELYNIPYDLVKLIKDYKYETQMRVELYSYLVNEHGEEKAVKLLSLFKLSKSDIPKGKSRMKKYKLSKKGKKERF